MTLADFLLARIAEDEERVSQAIGTTPWAVNPPNLFHAVALRHLGDCDAKRQIIELFSAADEHHENYRRHVAEYDLVREAQTVRDQMGRVLRLLALPYADHEDFRDEWKP